MDTRKTALVTGASSNIGQGIAIVLAEHGYDVAFTYSSNEEGALETKAAIEAAGRTCFYYQANLEELDAPGRVVKQAIGDLGHLDVLVNNAGRTIFGSILTMPIEDMHTLFQLDFRNYMLCTRFAARHMVKNGIRGNILFITSTRGGRAYAEDFMYGGMKAALNRACESIALDLSPYGIRVNCIAPGATWDVEKFRKKHPEFGEPDLSFVPLGRSGNAREMGELAAFLASDRAGYITGDTIKVDGGLVLPGIPERGHSTWVSPEWTKKHYDQLMSEEE